MRLALVAAALLVAAGLGSAYAAGAFDETSHPHVVETVAPPPLQLTMRPQIEAARASNAGLFAIFPRLPGVRRCAIPLSEGLHESRLAGMCRTSMAHPVTHGRYAETFVTFRESWRGHYSSWTLIVQQPGNRVVATRLHGEPAPQLRYAATDTSAKVAR